MWLALWGACAQPEPTPETEKTTPEPAVMSVTVTPPAIAFGDVGAGAPSVQTVTLTNDGTEAVTLSALSTPEEELTVVADSTEIAPGGQDVVTLTWTPAAPETLSTSLRVQAQSASGEIREIPVPVTGTAAGPVLQASTSALDLGTVLVGCEGAATFTLENVGTGTLEVTALDFVEGAGFGMYGTDGGPLPALPLQLIGGATLDLLVTFAPVDEGYVADLLRIETNDAASPRFDLQVAAQAQVEAENSITFDPLRKENVTVLIAANAVIVNQFYDAFSAALPVFFDTLQAAEVDYRVAFTVVNEGTVDGYAPYVDNTWTTADSVVAVDEMIDAASGDLDTLFEALENGLTANADWLFDDDARWAESSLNLVGINNDVEQSYGGNYVVYLGQYRARKEDPDDVVMHGIGGDVPRGCSGADPAQGWYDAAMATGGTFASICAADWEPSMTALAEGCLGDHEVFPLTGEPAEWSIRVYVDDTEQTTGWAYQSSVKTVTFDDDHYPAVGAVVRIDYFMEVECP